MPELHAPELHRPNSVGYDSRMLTWVFRWCGTPALLTSLLLAASSVPPKELPLRQPAVAKKVSFRCQLHIRLADPMYVLVHTMPTQRTPFAFFDLFYWAEVDCHGRDGTALQSESAASLHAT